MNTFSFDAAHNGYKAVNKTVLQPAIKETCEIMLNPPAHLLEMYGDFLIEAAPIIENEYFFTLGQKFINIAEKWDDISNDMWQLS